MFDLWLWLDIRAIQMYAYRFDFDTWFLTSISGATCLDMVVCRGCYSQIHEIHPIHAFLNVPEAKQSDPSTEVNDSIEPGERCRVFL
jgi:hypothetical protein